MIKLLLMILFTIHVVYSMKGGSPAHLGEFKYIASIQKEDFHYCSGVIIDKQHIVTVAHRIANSAVEDLRVVVGKIKVRPRWGTRLYVEKGYFHPGFGVRNIIDDSDNMYYEHDIAVLKLTRILILTPMISPVSLVNKDHDWRYHTDCLLISWNIPNNRNEPMILKWELIKLMSNDVHQQWASYLGENQKFFSDYFRTAAIGKEDLGSPVICGNLMAGLVIKGERPEIAGKSSIVMSIAPYLEFIEDVMHDGLFELDSREFPYIASVWYNGNYFCGGFIVDATHVATVGHCVMTYEIGNFTVAVGNPSLWFSLANIAIHMDYKVETTDVPPNWYIDHDFALLTLAEPILWDQRTSPIPLAESDDFHVGQLCTLLRWKNYRDEGTGVKKIKLMSSRVIILNNECYQPQLDPSPQSQVPSFWGKSQYLIPIANNGDVGNPIICDGKPVGFLIQAIPFDGEHTALITRFLKIRPYIELRNSSRLRSVLP